MRTGLDSIRLASSAYHQVTLVTYSECTLLLRVIVGRPAVPLLFVFEELDVVILSWSILHDGGSNITNVTVENLFGECYVG